MGKTRKILLLPGDGIGPEVIAEVRKILEWMNKTKSLDFVLSQELIGGASIDANKVPITDEVFYKSLELNYLLSTYQLSEACDFKNSLTEDNVSLPNYLLYILCYY